jgi:hypothetical protein
MDTVNVITFIAIMEIRKPLLSLSECSFTDWIKERIRSAKLANNNGYFFIINGTSVCKEAFQILFGISEYKFNIAEENLSSITVHGNTGKRRISSWAPFLIQWFTQLIADYCDYMPNKEIKYLPTYFTKEMVHSMASIELAKFSDTTISQTYFNSFWKLHFNTVKIPKNFRMGRCDVCLEMMRLKQSSITKAEIKQKQQEHNYLHSKSRSYCNILRQQAAAKPYDIMYLQYDGKQASRIPHIIPLPKDTQTLPRVKLHVYGVSNFSENETQFYLFLPHWETGANISISILYDHILRQFKTMLHKRPPKLILQVDNCAKEGKNKFVFAFAAHLIYFDWFKEVEIVSLIQGHTHDLIDQEFSVWAEGERKRCCETLDDISEFISWTFKNSVKKHSFTLLRWMFDWSGFFTPTLTEITGIKEARCFRFLKNTSNNIVLYWKTNCLESTWKGFKIPNDDTIYGIQICSQFLNTFPNPVPPSFLSYDDLKIIAEKQAFTACYRPYQLRFWENILIDSTKYLESNESLKNESK